MAPFFPTVPLLAPDTRPPACSCDCDCERPVTYSFSRCQPCKDGQHTVTPGRGVLSSVLRDGYAVKERA